MFLNIQLPRGVPFIRMGHPFGIVVNDGTRFGRNCTLFHHVTLAGQRFGSRAGAPRLGDDVIVFPNSVIVGNVTIGDRSVIGAGSVVVGNIPADSIAAGNPARVIAVIVKGSK
jgi:serine acetyltransferase